MCCVCIYQRILLNSLAWSSKAPRITINFRIKRRVCFFIKRNYFRLPSTSKGIFKRWLFVKKVCETHSQRFTTSKTILSGILIKNSFSFTWVGVFVKGEERIACLLQPKCQLLSAGNLISLTDCLSNYDSNNSLFQINIILFKGYKHFWLDLLSYYHIIHLLSIEQLYSSLWSRI